MLWCTVPVWLACLWFVAEIVLSLVRMLRVIRDAEGRRRLSVLRMRRRLQRKSDRAGRVELEGQRRHQRRRQRESGVVGREGAAGVGGGKEDDGGGRGGGADSLSSLPLGQPLLGRAPSSRLRRHLSRGVPASPSAPSPSSPASADKGEGDEERADGWWGSSDGRSGGSGDGFGGGGGGRQKGAAAPSTPESQPKMAALPTVSYDGGDVEKQAGDNEKISLFATPAEVMSSSLKSPPSPLAAASGTGARREVQIGFLLQAWLRLWVTMAFFATILAAFMALLSLRLFGFQAVSAGWIGSPCIIALAVLGLHSLLLLDGTGGLGGAPVTRSGGNRLVVGLGRRPVILLTLVSAVLVVLKVDSASAGTTSNGTWAVAVLVGKVHWGFVFLPVWVTLFLLEVVYVIALWENHTGASLAWSMGLRGGAKGDYPGGGGGGGGADGLLGGLCCCLNEGSAGSWEPPRWWSRASEGKGEYARLTEDDRGGGQQQQQQSARGGSGAAGELRRREQHQQEAPASAGVTRPSYFNGSGGGGGFRRSVELTPSQRAAASSIAAGLFLLTMTVISATVGSMKNEASWGVPVTFLTAAVGLALVSRASLKPFFSARLFVFACVSGRWIIAPCLDIEQAAPNGSQPSPI